MMQLDGIEVRMRWESWSGRGARHNKDAIARQMERRRPILGVSLMTFNWTAEGIGITTQFDPCQPTGTRRGCEQSRTVSATDNTIEFDLSRSS